MEDDTQLRGLATSQRQRRWPRTVARAILYARSVARSVRVHIPVLRPVCGIDYTSRATRSQRVAGVRHALSKNLGDLYVESGQTLQGSCSAVSKPNFASKYSLESSRRDLHNALLCTVLESQFFSFKNC